MRRAAKYVSVVLLLSFLAVPLVLLIARFVWPNRIDVTAEEYRMLTYYDSLVPNELADAIGDLKSCDEVRAMIDSKPGFLEDPRFSADELQLTVIRTGSIDMVRCFLDLGFTFDVVAMPDAFVSTDGWTPTFHTISNGTALSMLASDGRIHELELILSRNKDHPYKKLDTALHATNEIMGDDVRQRCRDLIQAHIDRVGTGIDNE